MSNIYRLIDLQKYINKTNQQNNPILSSVPLKTNYTYCYNSVKSIYNYLDYSETPLTKHLQLHGKEC